MHDKKIKLRKAGLTTNGWRDVIEDGNTDNHCKTPFIFYIQKKSHYISQEAEKCEFENSDVVNDKKSKEHNIANL